MKTIERIKYCTTKDCEQSTLDASGMLDGLCDYCWHYKTGICMAGETFTNKYGEQELYACTCND